MIASSSGDTGMAIVAIYLLPAIIAFSRQMPNKGTISVINVFLGWTFVGWVIALAWACKSKVPVTRNVKVSLGQDTLLNGQLVAPFHGAADGPATDGIPRSTVFCPTCSEASTHDAHFCKSCGSSLA